MRRYAAALIGGFCIPFFGIWALIQFDFSKIATGEYQIYRAHADLLARCDVGSLDILGDSTANAAFLPSRIGPRVRDFAVGGGTPIEAYFVARSILKCRNPPKAVILAFTPSSFAMQPLFPDADTLFWNRSVEYGVVNFSGAMQVLRDSRRARYALIAGPPSLFDLDYRVKALLYGWKFPPYLAPEIEDSAAAKLGPVVMGGILGFARLGSPPAKPAMEQNADAAAASASLSTGKLMYDQTIADQGHHFYGMSFDGGDIPDHDAGRRDLRLSPLADIYIRQTIRSLAEKNIAVFLVEPPRDRNSVAYYAPGLIGRYQAYLAGLQSAGPAVRLIGGGFPAWDSVLFGDNLHLNLRGSLIFSEAVRAALVDAGEGGLTYPADRLQPVNLAAKPDMPAPAMLADPVASPPPPLAYPVQAPVWRLHTGGADSADGQAATGAAGLDLAPRTNYAASVFVRNIDADRASLRLSWPGGLDGTISWDFRHRWIGYSGQANKLNSGVTICPGGWVQLFIGGRTGNGAGTDPGPVVSIASAHAAAAEFYDIRLEQGLWPTNYCLPRAGELQSVPPG